MNEDEKIEEFIVTARKWRPQKFSDVVGQEHITTTLLNAIHTGRIHHAYLFCGPRGVGKTTTARILARALNCLEPMNFEPCNKCESCKAILDGRSLDVIEIDGASNNSVDDVRKLRENVKYPPILGKYKMYVIDEVHMLSTSAFNALLKTLEEPPPHLLFVFATTESHKVPATIISRCQRFDFRRMKLESIADQIRYIANRENINIDEESLVTIAKKADGSMRDGQSIFDQVVAFCGTDIKYIEMADALHLIDQDFFFRISQSILQNNINEMFKVSQEVFEKGYDLQECLQGLLEHYRNILTINSTGDTTLIESSSSFIEKYKSEAKEHTLADLLRIMNLISTAEQSLRYAPQPRLRFELTLVQLASLDKAQEITELIKEVKSLKQGIPAKPNLSSDNTLISKEKKVDYKTELTSKIEKEIKEEVQIDIKLEKKPKVSENSDLVPDNREIITSDNIESQWPAFVKKYANAKSGLFMISQVKPVLNGDEIILNTGQEIVSDNLKLLLPKLSAAINEFFGKNLTVQINYTPEIRNLDIGSKEIPDSTQNNPDIPINNELENKDIKIITSNKNIKSVNNDLNNLHPIERDIIEIFGGQRIDSR